jgi:cell division protein FtsW (lipid II flippase)
MVTARHTAITEYIDAVCAHIKFAEVHQEIRLELQNHLQEQVGEYLSRGFSETEAVSRAIAQLGSPDMVGKQFDRVHRSRPEWGVLALSLLFSGLGLLAMYFIERQGLPAARSIPVFTRTLALFVVGALIVTGLYLFDYQKLERFSGHIYLGTVSLLAFTIIFGQQANGSRFLSMGPLSINFVQISPIMLSMALAGIFSKWDWNQPGKLPHGLLLGALPLILILAAPSLSTGVIYCTACITIIIASGAGCKKSLVSIGMLSGALMLPLINSPSQLQRLTAFIHPGQDPSGSGWLNTQLVNLMGSSGLWGQGPTAQPQLLPGLHTDFVFSYLTFTFGWIAGGVLATLAVIFIIRTAAIARLVKSPYARLLVSGIAAIFTVQFLWNILMNMGLAPLSGVGLPFISYGGSQLLFNAAAMGIVSSAYRRRNISKTIINS